MQNDSSKLKNESEKLFEQYLDSNGFQGQWIYEPSLPGKSKRPDYLLSWKGNKVFLDGGKMINGKRGQPQNTTINAIVVLEAFLDNSEIEKAMQEEVKKQERELTEPELVEVRMKLQKNHKVRSVLQVVVIENPFAQMSFPEDLFNGPFDERWRWIEKQSGKSERVFVGSKLKELEGLKGKFKDKNAK